MLPRYKIYEEFFGILERAAHYRIEKESSQANDLKIFEKFIVMLSNEEIQQIVKFVKEESPELNIKLKRHKTTNKIKSSVKITHELVTVATIDGEIYRSYKEINKKTKQILSEHKNKLLLEKEKREEILQSENYFEDEEYCKQRFEEQDEFQSQNAFKWYLEGDHEQACDIEASYRLLEKPSKNIHIIPDYGIFLYVQEVINERCEHIFNEKIDEIVNGLAKKNIVQYLLETDSAFTVHLDTLSDLLKIPPKLLLHFGKESFTGLLKNFQINYTY